MTVKKLGLIAVVFSISFSTLAADAVSDKKFLDILDSTEMKRSFIRGPIIEGQASYTLTNKRNIGEQLNTFGEVNISNNNVSLTDSIDYAQGYIKQCVGFVKATDISLTDTDSWEPDGKAMKSYVTKGDIIATFDSNNKYTYSGHTGVVIKTEINGIWVIDQNYYLKGFIRIHFIDKKDGNYLGENINNYSLVKY